MLKCLQIILILENISNKNDLITINNAQKIYNFLFNNFHIKGKDENENVEILGVLESDISWFPIVSGGV